VKIEKSGGKNIIRRKYGKQIKIIENRIEKIIDELDKLVEKAKEE
jgi:hypothetical protein